MKLATLALATLATVATVAETVKTASQPWVTNNVAQAVAPVTAGVATNAAMIAALDHRVDKAALNWVYIPDPSSPWTCTMSGKELLLDYVGPIVSSESFSFRWQCSTNSNWWLEYVVYRKWSNSSLVLQADGNFWECGGEWRRKAGEELPRCYEPCDANSLSFKTAIGLLITMTRDTTDLRAEPALLRNAYLNDIWEVEKDVATNAARIAEMETDVAALAAETNTYLTAETDPTIYDWAKAVTKPGYSYSEISGTPDLGQYSTTGAVAQVARDLSAVSNLAVNAVQTETDPTVPSWAKASNKPGYSYSEISNTPDLSGYATTAALDNYLPLSGGVVTGNVFVAQQTGDTNAMLAAVGEQTYGRFSLPAIGTYPDRSIDYEDERTIAALLKEDDMPLLRLERIKHGRYSTYDSFTNSLQTIEYEKAELDMDGLGHVRIDKDGNSVACDIRWPEPPEGTNYVCGTIAIREDIPEVPSEWDYTAITNAPWLTSYTETDPTVPSWAKASSKPGYTLNEICPDAENWLGVQGDAGRCIKVLAGTVGGQIVGGMRVTASTLNDNNMTTYTYGGVAVRRNGTNQDYLWDGSSTNGIVRRGELASVATSGSYNDLTNAPDLGQYSTTGAVAQVARDLSAVSNVAASAVQTETDPTVPSWAKVTTPPYLTSETDPTVPSAANAATNYTDSVAARYLPLTGGELTGDLLLPATNEVSVGGLDAGSTHYGYGYIYHDSSYLLTLPNKSGTFALTADVAAATNALVRGPSVYFATCATAAATRAKVLVFDSADSSRLGDIATRGNTLFVKFDKAQTYNGVPQLSINGTTYLIYMVGTTGATRYEWVAGEVVQFVYDGEQWMLVDAGRATTSYYGVTKLTTSVSSTSTSTALTPASLSGYIAGTIDDTPVYATNTAHAVGARARYGNYTWECTNAVAAGVAWNEADWRELPPLQAQIDELSSVSAAEYASATNRIAALEAQLAGLEAALHNINTGE